MLRSARHAKILELISQKEIETQEELCAELNRLNYVVTQATISRDIRDLHLFKVAGMEKKYRYAYINDGESEISPKMKSLFRECVLSVKSAQNLVVVKTLIGNGGNAGAVVDKLSYEEIIGSVAGDDTLLIICTNTDAAEIVVEKLNGFLKYIIKKAVNVSKAYH
jgi:transcriptional regulator of arginine metabolism